MQTLYSDLSISISEFKKNPAAVLKSCQSQAVAVLSHNKPAFYMVPSSLYASMIEEQEDAQLQKLVQARLKERSAAIEVDINTLA